MTFEPLDAAIGRFAAGRMTNGDPAIFSIESIVGLDGFMGRGLCGSSGTVSKAGYIPWAGVTVHETRFAAENARDLLPGAIDATPPEAGAPGSDEPSQSVHWKGMSFRATPPAETVTLWDRYAMAALPSVMHLCDRDTLLPGESIETAFARKAYAIADAMLAERARRMGEKSNG